MVCYDVTDKYYISRVHSSNRSLACPFLHGKLFFENLSAARTAGEILGTTATMCSVAVCRIPVDKLYVYFKT